jgi:riboflavin biosynthesis pyrimidine reductase
LITDPRADFEQFAARKTREAAAAHIATLATISERRNEPSIREIGNAWSRAHYDGGFPLFAPPDTVTALSLVFVQSKNGNTGGTDPGSLGGGATDTHLIYEGLSRVAADAVLAGARSVHGEGFFSVWHPELVALRDSLGLARHPAQIVVSQAGRLDFDARLFNVPDARVFLIATDEAVSRHASALDDRPWIRHLPLAADDLRSAMDRLRNEGIRRISCIGGRATASRLVDAGLVQELYLTTTAREGGESGTPWYTGAGSPRLRIVTTKEWIEAGSPVRFEHILLS